VNTDENIRDLCKTGLYKQAFEEIVRIYSQRLYWHIRKMVLAHDNADDILQNTLLKVWTGLPSFRWESKLYTWLYRIATNEVLTFIKKTKPIRTFRSKIDWKLILLCSPETKSKRPCKKPLIGCQTNNDLCSTCVILTKCATKICRIFWVLP